MTDTPAKAPAGLRGEIATPVTDIYTPQWVGLLRPTDSVLASEGRGKGLAIYDEIERDPIAFAVLQKRKLGLIAREWQIQPGGTGRKDKAAADLARRVLAGEWGLSFDRLCLNLLDATLKGYAVAEIIWDVRDGFIIPVEIKPKNQRRFVFDPDSRLRLLTRQNSYNGIDLPERKFLVHRFGDKDGDPYGRGLGHQLFWWSFFKRMDVRFWLTFAEKFGSPTVIGEVAGPLSEPEEDVLLAKLESIAQRTAITVPEGVKVSLLEAVRSGTVTYPELVEYCDRMITIAVLGETLTTSEGNAGSRALGQVHAGVKDEIVDADADLLSASLNAQLLSWLTDLNFPDARPPGVWRPRPTQEKTAAEIDQEKLKARRAALDFCTAMRQAGWVPQEAGADIMEQAVGAWTYSGRTTAAPDGEAPPALAGSDDQAAVADLADQLAQNSGGMWEALVGRVAALLDEVERDGGELEDVLSRLANLYPTLNPADLARLIGDAMVLSNLTGRADIADDR